MRLECGRRRDRDGRGVRRTGLRHRLCRRDARVLLGHALRRRRPGTVAVSSTQTAGSTGLALAGTVTSALFAGDDYTLTFVVNPLQLLQCFSAQGMTAVSVSAVGIFSRPLLCPDPLASAAGGPTAWWRGPG